MGIEICIATLNMADKIAKMHINSCKEAYKNIVPSSFYNNISIKKWVQRYRFGKDLEEDDYFFVIKLKSTIIGLLQIGKYRDDDDDIDDIAEIGGIYLSPDYWNKGYGKIMIEYTIDFLSKKSYKKIAVWVLEKNSRAINFYKKQGFEPDGVSKSVQIGKELRAVRFSKTINETH